MERKRGRPRTADNPASEYLDLTIAKTVHHLSMYGFDLRSQIYPVVSEIATEKAKHLARLGQIPDERKLGAAAIEKIYKTKLQATAWYQPQRIAHQYTKDSRRYHSPPNLSAREIARILFEHGGEFPRMKVQVQTITGEFIEREEPNPWEMGDLDFVPEARENFELYSRPFIRKKTPQRNE